MRSLVHALLCVVACHIYSASGVHPATTTTESHELDTINGHSVEEDETTTRTIGKHGMIAETTEWTMRMPTKTELKKRHGARSVKTPAVSEAHVSATQPHTALPVLPDKSAAGKMLKSLGRLLSVQDQNTKDAVKKTNDQIQAVVKQKMENAKQQMDKAKTDGDKVEEGIEAMNSVGTQQKGCVDMPFVDEEGTTCMHWNAGRCVGDEAYKFVKAPSVDDKELAKLTTKRKKISAREACCACGGGMHGAVAKKLLHAEQAWLAKWKDDSKTKKKTKKASKPAAKVKVTEHKAPRRAPHHDLNEPTPKLHKHASKSHKDNVFMNLLPVWILLGAVIVIAAGGMVVYMWRGGLVFPSGHTFDNDV